MFTFGAVASAMNVFPFSNVVDFVLPTLSVTTTEIVPTKPSGTSIIAYLEALSTAARAYVELLSNAMIAFFVSLVPFA